MCCLLPNVRVYRLVRHLGRVCCVGVDTLQARHVVSSLLSDHCRLDMLQFAVFSLMVECVCTFGVDYIRTLNIVSNTARVICSSDIMYLSRFK